MRPLCLSSHSPCYIDAHPHTKYNGLCTTSTISYFNHPWGCKSTTSSTFCCQNIETMRGYGELSSVFSPSERSTAHMNALKDLVIDDGVPNTSSSSPLMETCDCIERVKFLRGKNYFLTGPTGFLAKLWLKKMLWSVPDVGKIFLLIKAKDKETAMDRLKNEIIGSELFKCLEQIHGESYTDFMMSKLVSVIGDVCKSNLGMDATSATEIAKAVDVIVNSAANTILDERYDAALNTNTKGPSRLVSFAKKCKKPSLSVHVSTAYVNGEREGVVSEKPFCIGESIAGERATSENSSTSFPVLDVDAEIELASNVMESLKDSEVPADMVVNATMAATAKQGNAGKPGLHVYHITSSVANPLVLGDAFKFSCDHFNSSPLIDSKGKRIDITGMKYFSPITMDTHSSYIGNKLVQQGGLMDATISDQKLHRVLELKCKRKVERVLHMVRIYEPYIFYRGR